MVGIPDSRTLPHRSGWSQLQLFYTFCHFNHNNTFMLCDLMYNKIQFYQLYSSGIRVSIFFQSSVDEQMLILFSYFLQDFVKSHMHFNRQHTSWYLNARMVYFWSLEEHFTHNFSVNIAITNWMLPSICNSVSGSDFKKFWY